MMLKDWGAFSQGGQALWEEGQREGERGEDY